MRMITQPLSDLTPLMRQYYAVKQQHPHALVLFQVGDFYELFFDDAKRASAFLGIALTKRGKINGDPIPLCGVPVHALDHYLTKLVRAGFKVAICDQLEEAKPGKTVDRGVTQVLTPGTLTDPKLLDEKSASYLFSFFSTQDQWGLLFAELLTAQLFATVLPIDALKGLESELSRFFPDEIILPDDKQVRSFETYFKQQGYCTTIVSNQSDLNTVDQWMNVQLPEQARAYVSGNQSMLHAVQNFYSYLHQTQQSALDQFKSLHWYAPEDFLILDHATQTNLELVKNAHDGSRKNSLFSIIDGALTPMGSRMIKKWILRPLVKQPAIEQRQDAIAQLMANIVIMQQLEQILSEFGDVERIIGRIALRRATYHDYLHVKRVLGLLPQLHTILQNSPAWLLSVIMQQCTGFESLYYLLDRALNDDTSKEWIIKSGFNAELDGMRDLCNGATSKVLALEQQEQQATGINSLKVRYNQMYGYYIEITKTHLDAIPAHYIRQQTLVGRERYVTKELQQLQHEILHAQSQVSTLEKTLFEQIKQDVCMQISQLRKLSHALSNLDALCGLSRISYQYGYVRPTFNDQATLTIQQGRHPIVERVMDAPFIPNDTQLDTQNSTWIITGPNMGGKSTYLRQVALIGIMAQIGCFVPAKMANLSILDRIFTRIGAGDNLAQGKSTFLVEMEETSAICTQATAQSLVILDEVGRGTSTFDGLAIAQAVVEFIHTTIKARCLFATHYHELTLLPQNFKGIVCHHAASKKNHNGIQFLYKIMPGVAQGSFGVEVAKLAQLPFAIVNRAEHILDELQSNSHAHVMPAIPDRSSDFAMQKIEQLQAQLNDAQKKLAALSKIDYDHLSPKAALDLLWKFKE